jgi:putative ABC transport system permease protein
MDPQVTATKPEEKKTANAAFSTGEDKAVSVVLLDVKKDYYIDKKPFPALKGVTIAFPSKGFISILGPSGCGKTTFLNIIGGLDHYTAGDLLIDGKSTKDFKDSEWDSYRNERVGFVFQSYNLIPQESVLANVEVSLMLNGVNKKERTERAMRALANVGLADEAKKRPNQLSGGQQQRVALARAMINNPKIVLADEPTGALDSKTSIQVLDLFKQISQDRLVIMVTHNRKLADQYSDRIIEMFDGVITADSHPLLVPKEKPIGKDIGKKTSMSFWTAFKSSLKSINTKKTRTVLTAVASSFGLIGVALVLAVTNGFTNYMDNVEGSVASSVPITITPQQMSYISNDTTEKNDYPKDGNLVVYDTSNSAYVSHTNRYNQTYFDYVQKSVNLGYARSVMFNRQLLSFNLMTQDGDKTNLDGTPIAKSVDQYSSASTSSSIISSVTSLPATIFHELYGEEKGLSTMYDCIFGHYPQETSDPYEAQLALVVDRYNRIDFSTLQKLGVFNSDATFNTLTDQEKRFSFSKLIYEDGDSVSDYKAYSAYLNSDYYDMTDANGDSAEKEETADTWTVNRFNSSTQKFEGTASTKTFHYFDVQKNPTIVFDDATGRYHPIHLKIVGVLRPSPDSYINLMPASIGYLSSLKEKFATDVAKGGPGEKLAECASDAYYIARNDADSSKDGLATLNNAIKTAFVALGNGGSTSLSESSLSDVMSGVYTYRSFARYEGTVSPGTLSFSSFLRFNRYVGGDFREANLTDIPETPTSVYDPDNTTWSHFMSFWLDKIQDPSFYNCDYADASSWGAIDFLAYFNAYALVSSILVFPASLTTKDKLRSYLDAYNEKKSDQDTILYSDIMETLTGSLGILIQVISIVLIVFASISLVVSSVMTGIITYVSVIERTKEIGILRACGARKVDVARLFEAECATIGMGAGLIGTVFTYLICIPINQILDHQFPGNNLSNIAFLNPWHAVVLLVLAVILAMVSGAIPAVMASRKDPVLALRTE